MTARSLSELLATKFPSTLTKRIELDENFLTQAKKWPDQILDFSPYSDLEVIEVKGAGEIRKINVGANEKLKCLIFPNQELAGVLDCSQNSQLERVDITNNLLTDIWVHNNIYANTRQWFGINGKTPQPQKHNKEKIQFKDLTAKVYLGEKPVAPKQQSQALSWKDFHKWLSKEIIDSSELLVKIRENKKSQYSQISSSALNRFWESLEATLDKNGSQIHLLPEWQENKDLPELLDPCNLQLGKKTESKKIGWNSYQVLWKMWQEWKGENPTAKISELKMEIQRIKSEKEEAETKAQLLEQRNAELKKKLTSQNTPVNNWSEQRQKEQQKFQTEKAKIRQEKAELEKELQFCQKQIETLQQEMEDREQEITDWKRKLTKQEDQILNYQTQLSLLQQQGGKSSNKNQTENNWWTGFKADYGAYAWWLIPLAIILFIGLFIYKKVKIFSN